MTTTVTIEVPPFAAAEPPVEMDVHHIFRGGEILSTPVRTLQLRVGTPNEITIHSRMALAVRVGARDRLPLDITHGDKAMTRGLLLTELTVPDTGEVVELSRRRVPPGEAIHIALENSGVLVIREIEEPAP